MSLRRVIVSKMFDRPTPERPNRSNWVLEPEGEALFHGFGIDFEEFDNGVGSFTTAIVEWPDGRLQNVRVDHVKFVKD